MSDAVDLSKLPPPPAEALPATATPTAAPAAELPAQVTPTVELPAAPTPTLTYDGGFLNGLPPFEVLMGGGIRTTPTALSVNNAAPYQEYDEGNTFALRGSVFLTPKFLGGKWNYNTQAFALGQLDDIDGPLGKLWSVGLGAAARFMLPMHYATLAIVPDVAGSLGIFWMREPVDVGIPDQLYWAAESYKFPQLHAGLGIYCGFRTGLGITPYRESIVTAGIHSGIRWMWHADHVSNVSSGQDTVVRLQSPMWETIKILLGVRF